MSIPSELAGAIPLINRFQVRNIPVQYVQCAQAVLILLFLYGLTQIYSEYKIAFR